MKPWSRYNTLFRSARNGWFLYNALSGIMLELDEAHYRIACSLRDAKRLSSGDIDNGFMELLEKKGILAERQDEQLKLMESRYQRNATCFSTATLSLTICPTLACNFACPYCFEQSQNDETIMRDETIAALAEFIKQHHDARTLTVSWYGGEATLAFDVIDRLTKKFIELYPDYDNAGMVTNAYLLDQEKIDRLKALKITSIQITLDGSEATHNKRRMLKNGGATYERILHNIDLLMNSSWEGSCAIRVNVDKTNQEEYAALHTELLERYKGKDLSVYPGYVNTFEGHDYSDQCGFDNSDRAAFTLNQYQKEGIVPKNGFFPGSGVHNTCAATNHYFYVVSPNGELYKCWEDVGQADSAIGSVHEDKFVTNPELVARYSIGTDPFNDSGCMECRVLPICGGGCVRKRLRRQHYGEKGIDYCSPLKESLTDYLDAYIDTWQTKQICDEVLGKGGSPSMEQGYRMVQPEEKKGEAETMPS
ncbi:radical SAM/SPASM domain-containing protein [Prosthecochloris sp. ZM]|uniref:radical SAM/SPASM domain-containing protein n=1 Tax=Prosthecochloris sp. ZM TaxID=2283143 RepID=UPI000DF7DAAF|nr:radical SAM protein [Prosthecochloris sp. ZM]RDD31141.1 radical SAM/SPASM domain-containing protein [Prosthecochloris sp. ZM]